MAQIPTTTDIDLKEDIQVAVSDALASVTTTFDDLGTVDRRTFIDIESSQGTSILRDVTETTNSGNIPKTSASSGEIHVETGTTSGSSATLETARYGQYVPGYIVQQGIGIRPDSQPSGDASIEWGYFDGQNGFHWGYDSDGLYVVRLRDGVVEEKTYRDQWNKSDPDEIREEGSFDPAGGSIYQIDFAWYGYGVIDFYIAFGSGAADDQKVLVHRMFVSGTTSIVNPNQPIRVTADNGSTTDNVQVYTGGRQLSIFGEETDNLRIAAETNDSVSVSDGSWTHIISMRRESTNGRRTNITVDSIDLSTDSDIKYAVVLNSSLSSTTYSTPSLVPADETEVEVSTAGSFDGIGDGIKLWEGFLSSDRGGSTISVKEKIDQIVPRSQPVSLIAYGTAGTATVDGTLKLREGW